MTAEKYGVKTAPHFWPGAEVNFSQPLGGPLPAGPPNYGLPSYRRPYDRGVDKLERVAGLLALLQRPVEQQPRLLTLYMEDVDDAGHAWGPVRAGPETLFLGPPWKALV